ncbi:MAG TPA: hypothetical protein VNX65_01115 [Patescibacteria group bacterium]|jgi:hypothetical protein|nr:hypothetical protein [Patescibacteria group bacterium]
MREYDLIGLEAGGASCVLFGFLHVSARSSVGVTILHHDIAATLLSIDAAIDDMGSMF